MSKWLVNSALSIGKSHLRAEPIIPCQDNVLTCQQKGVIVMALSDGCGSSSISQYGSEITVKALCDILTKDFNELYLLSDVELKKKIIAGVVDGLKAFISSHTDIINEFKQNNPNHYQTFINNWQGFNSAEKIYPLTLLDATVQFVAIKGHKAIIGRLGDGIIGMVKDKSLSILSMEDKVGVEENVTMYPSTILLALENPNFNPWNAFEIIKLDDANDCSMFLITSDGLEDVFVGEDDLTKFLYIDEISYLINNSLNLEDVLNNKYKNYKGVYDDLSVCLMTKNKVKIDNIIIREYDDKGQTINNTKKQKIDLEQLAQDLINEEQTDNKQDIKVDLPKEIDELINKYTQDDEYRICLKINTSKMIDIMKEYTSISFDNLLTKLRPNIDELDLLQMCIYWQKLKLFRCDRNKRIIEKW